TSYDNPSRPRSRWRGPGIHARFGQRTVHINRSSRRTKYPFVSHAADTVAMLFPAVSVRPYHTPHPNSAAGGHTRDQVHQDVMVDRLDQVVVESRVCSSPAIVSLPPPGEGD